MPRILAKNSKTTAKPDMITATDIDPSKRALDVNVANELTIEELPDIEIDLTPNAIVGGVKTIGTAGTGEKIITASTPAQYVIITALLANTGTIYVGGSDVDKTTMNGISLTVAADKDGIKVPGSCIIPINDANKVWIDSTVNGNGVSFVVV